MSRLNQVLNDSNLAQQGIKPRQKRNIEVPTYDTTGKTVNPEKKEKQKKLAIIILIVTAIVGFIYIPGIFMTLFSKDTTQQDYTVTVNSGAIKLVNDMFSMSPSEDFDNDGLENDKEQNVEMTNPWNTDSDGDCASDYYELYISKTSPNTYDNTLVIEEQKEQDNEGGKSVSTPYRMGNVILWADDYTSKALGGVIESVNGYNFNNFTGYAQFPNDTDIYAYGVTNGIRTLLPYRSDENAWRIDDVEKVEIYTEKLEEIVELDLFFHPFYLGSNAFTNALACIFPDKGFITFTKKTRMDVEPDTRQDTTATIVKPDYDEESTDRFKQNTISLANLQYVRSMVDEGRCVAVSLYDMNDGEYIGIVYGYDYNGDLLIADPDTLSPIGTIEIKEVGQKMLDDENTFVLHSFFSWEGLGFSSSSYDRISFFAVADSSGTYLTPDMNMDDTVEEDSTSQDESTTEFPTEEISTELETTTEITTETETTTEETTEMTTETTTQETTTELTTEATTETPTTEKTTKSQSTQSNQSSSNSSKKKSSNKKETLDSPDIE